MHIGLYTDRQTAAHMEEKRRQNKRGAGEGGVESKKKKEEEVERYLGAMMHSNSPHQPFLAGELPSCVQAYAKLLSVTLQSRLRYA